MVDDDDDQGTPKVENGTPRFDRGALMKYEMSW